MKPLEVVIIAKNEAHIIGRTLQSVQQLTNNIIVCDTGSNDDTISVAKLNGARIVELKWQGYGITKNLANTFATHDWILQLDADEVLDAQLLASLLQVDLLNEHTAFSFVRKNYYTGRHLKYGGWGNDRCMRLFNRKTAAWNTEAVHEKLVYKGNVKIVSLNGYILHYTYTTIEEHLQKIENYTSLSAAQLFTQQKKSNFVKQYLSPAIGFVINYIFKLGFLDGYYGFKAASLSAYHTYLKYKKLRDLY